MLDLTAVDLELLSPTGTVSAVPPPPTLDDEWQKPDHFKRMVPKPPPPFPKPLLQVQVSAPSTAPVGDGALGGGFRSIAQVSQLPHFKVQVEAQYPEAAKRANIEGVVILQVDIDATGAVKKVELTQGLGYGCDEAAVNAAQQSVFTPAYAGSEPVPVRIRIPYRFRFEY